MTDTQQLKPAASSLAEVITSIAGILPEEYDCFKPHITFDFFVKSLKEMGFDVIPLNSTPTFTQEDVKAATKAAQEASYRKVGEHSQGDIIQCLPEDVCDKLVRAVLGAVGNIE